MPGHQRGIEAVLENLVARQRRAENRGLGPAGALRRALEEVFGDLGAGEGEQVGPLGLDVSRMSAD